MSLKRNLAVALCAQRPSREPFNARSQLRVTQSSVRARHFKNQLSRFVVLVVWYSLCLLEGVPRWHSRSLSFVFYSACSL